MISAPSFWQALLQKGALKPDGFQQDNAALLLCTLSINIMALALPVMTLQVYDRILPNPGTGTLPVLIVGVCIAILLELMLRLCRTYVIGRAGAAYEHRMACDTMGRVLGADLGVLGQYGVGEYLHRTSAVGKLKDFYNGHALTIAAELAFVPLFFGLIIYISHALAVVPAVILAAFVALALRRGKRLRCALKERETVDDRRFNFLIEALEGVHTLKAFALEKFFQRRYEAFEEGSTLANYRVTQETADTFNNGTIFSHLMVVSVISFGAWFVINGSLSSGGLIAALLLSGRIMQPVQKALALWTRYQDFVLASDNIIELRNIPQRILLDQEASDQPFPDGRLTLQGIHFQFAGAASPVLNGVNLALTRGDTVLLSGGHGSGKSTLFDLIARVHRPAAGTITLDGQDIRRFPADALTRHVGLVRTRPLIFRGTIRDNVTCFGQYGDSAAREISSLMGIDGDIAKLPGGFDTFLSGNNTDLISPGLKQRISIVRALVPKPRLILFDNADRSLDREGYEMIYSLLARLKGKATMVLISDDENIRALAERHYALEAGHIYQRDITRVNNNISAYRELRL